MSNTELSTQPIPTNAWFKSSYSGAGSGSDCVEVAPLVGGAAVRDSKDPEVGVLRFTAGSLDAFLAHIKG